MLLYTKIVNEEEKPVRKIYGTEGNIPADTDKEVTYKDAEGSVVALKAGDTYIDDGMGGIIRESDRSVVNVYVNDKIVIGKEAEKKVEEPVVKQQVVMKAAKKAVKVEEERSEERRVGKECRL